MRAYFGHDSNGNEWISADAGGWFAIIFGKDILIDVLICLGIGIISFITGLNTGALLLTGISYFLLFFLFYKLNKEEKPFDVGFFLCILEILCFVFLYLQFFDCVLLTKKIGEETHTYDLYYLFSVIEGVPIAIIILSAITLGTAVGIVLLISCQKNCNKKLLPHLFLIEAFLLLLIVVLTIVIYFIDGYSFGRTSIYIMLKCFLFLALNINSYSDCKKLIERESEGNIKKNKILTSLTISLGIISILLSSTFSVLHIKQTEKKAEISSNMWRAERYLEKNNFDELTDLDDYNDSNIVWAKKLAAIANVINKEYLVATEANSLLEMINTKFDVIFTFSEKSKEIIKSVQKVSDLEDFVSQFGISINNLHSYSFEFGKEDKNKNVLCDKLSFTLKVAVDKKINKITIPTSLKEIKNNQFEGFQDIKTITIPETTNLIGKSSFADCTNLKEINFNSINCDTNSTSEYVFSNVGKNTSGTIVNIGPNVKKIPKGLFYSPYQNHNIKTINFDSQSVCETIETSAFYGCSTVTSINLPNALKTIEAMAFCSNVGLTNIVLPENLECFGDSCFSHCTKLIEIIIPSSITELPSRLFEECTNLESITIPKSVKSIGSYAFSDCKNLKKIIYEGTTSEWMSISKGTKWDYGSPNYEVETI